MPLIRFHLFCFDAAAADDDDATLRCFHIMDYFRHFFFHAALILFRYADTC